MNSDFDELLLRRPTPDFDYVLTSKVLFVPVNIFEQTKRVFHPYHCGKVEACCFWYGKRDELDNGYVSTIVIPKQKNSWGNFAISPYAMERISNLTRRKGLLNLAQIHTHPGINVEHSTFDDSNVNSRRALSIVLPFYGAWQGNWWNAIGVHDFQKEYWFLLDEFNAVKKIKLLNDLGEVEIIDAR